MSLSNSQQILRTAFSIANINKPLAMFENYVVDYEPKNVAQVGKLDNVITYLRNNGFVESPGTYEHAPTVRLIKDETTLHIGTQYGRKYIWQLGHSK